MNSHNACCAIASLSLLLAAAVAPAIAGHPGGPATPLRELPIARAWCAAHGGESEHRLTDGTRIDCLTATHAVEVEWPAHWAQAIGQAMWYAQATGRRAAILLLARDAPADAPHVARLRAIIAAARLPIDIYRP